MAWGKSDKNNEEVPHIRKEERPASLSEALPKTTLNKDLQKIVDREDDFFDQLYDGQGADTTDTNYRYAAYANRIRTILLSAHRYVAYTSDVGESFRPVAHPILIRGAYAVSWAYLIGDVGHEGYKAYCRNQRMLKLSGAETLDATNAAIAGTTGEKTAQGVVKIPAIEDYRAIMVQRAVFQSIASMGLPAFTIHSLVKYSGKALKDVKNVTLRTWGPIGLGLAAVPALPYMFDEPVEKAVEWTFYNVFKTIGGDGAVGDAHAVGREARLNRETKKLAREKKEL